MTRDDLITLHEELTTKARDLMSKKNADYTGGGGPFANFDTAQIFGVDRVQGALIRMTDKMQRVNSFVTNGVLQVPDESVEDTAVDLINYAVLIAGMIRETKKTTGPEVEIPVAFPGGSIPDPGTEPAPDSGPRFEFYCQDTSCCNAGVGYAMPGPCPYCGGKPEAM